MSKTFEEIVSDVHSCLVIDNARWSINGQRGSITQTNVREVIQRGLVTLYGSPPATSFLIGGILIYKWDEDNYDIYVRRGEMNKEDVESNKYNQPEPVGQSRTGK